MLRRNCHDLEIEQKEAIAFAIAFDFPDYFEGSTTDNFAFLALVYPALIHVHSGQTLFAIGRQKEFQLGPPRPEIVSRQCIPLKRLANIPFGHRRDFEIWIHLAIAPIAGFFRSAT
jgi:hypothetical protein